MAYKINRNTDPEKLAELVNAEVTAGASVLGAPILAPNGVWYQATGPAPSDGTTGTSVVEGSAGAKPADLAAAPTANDFNALVAQLDAAGLFTA